MKKSILMAALGLLSLNTIAQDTLKEEGFIFTTVKENPITSVKNQNRAGTCWCYSGLAFIESELLRMGKGEYDFSEMFIVHNTYLDRADKAVRTHGDVSFSQGGSFYDVIYGMKTFGLVPEEEMRPGVMYGDTLSNHTELTAVSDAVVVAIAKGKHRSLQTDQDKNPLWKKAITAIHDIYLGERPEKFTYKGKEYTPASFAASLPIDLGDYVEFASFTHHPFYTEFAMEVPDNWNWDKVWNVPLDEFMEIIDNSLEKGYTIAWGTDVSEKGFSRTKGLGIIPEADIEGMEGTEAEKWGKLTQKEKEDALYKFDKPGKERTITQELRQEGYDNYETTDDHGMQIVGTAVDQNGTPYYKVKNSWDVRPPYDGYWYFSRPFVAYKSMTVLVNKNAVPKAILKKIDLK